MAGRPAVNGSPSRSPSSGIESISKGLATVYKRKDRPYASNGKVLPAFKLRVRDVVGFSVRKATRDDKKRLKASSLQEVLTVRGSGTTLAEVAVNYGTAQKIEDWFRAHMEFGQGALGQAPQAVTQVASVSIADELMKLAQLRDAGVISADEFDAQKSKLARVIKFSRVGIYVAGARPAIARIKDHDVSKKVNGHSEYFANVRLS